MTEAWYFEGLSFDCTQCGDCCTGEAGFVWVNSQEIASLALAVGATDIETFVQESVRKVGARHSLKELPNGDCVFFDGQRRACRVYEARPRQCRTWPFWESNLANPSEWARTCRVCPGCNRGPLHTFDEIELRRRVMQV